MPKLELPSEHLAIVRRILARHAPGAEVWAYGSRVTGGCHAGSDLDLVVRVWREAQGASGRLAALRAAFRESDLPILVEVQDWSRLPESFRREILSEHVVVARRPAAGAVRDEGGDPDEPAA